MTTSSPRRPMAHRLNPFQNNLFAALLIVIFAAVGTTLIIRTHASTSVASTEAESGTVTSPALAVSDASASGSRAIKFSTATVSGPVASATTPCVHAAAPAQWKHVVVLMFENKTYSTVIGTASAPYITNLASKCGSYSSWYDADYKVSGVSDGTYVSKPNYATLTSGVSPSTHGLLDDTYTTTTSVDNIFNRLNLAGKSALSYESGTAASCAVSNFSGAYHDPLRYYTDLGGQSASPSTYCNTHDVPIANFMTDVTNNTLPAFSFILPTNDQNMHNNTIASGDAWAQSFLTPFLNSALYKTGNTALFFLWDEDRPIPNVLVAPSIAPGTQPVLASGSYPIGHFSALRTWQEMLGITPLLGNTGQAPSLLSYYDGH